MRVTTPCIIEHNQKRLIVKDPEKEEQIFKWDDVVEASVCNMYCLIGDLVKIKFILKDERIVEIDEDMIGWSSIIKKFPDCLYGCKKQEEWCNNLNYEGFASDWIKIYIKKHNHIIYEFRILLYYKLIAKKNQFCFGKK